MRGAALAIPPKCTYNRAIETRQGGVRTENTLKQKLAAGARPIGTFFDTASVSLMECLGRTGLDFAIIDNEHSPIEAETTAALVRDRRGARHH